MKTPVSSSSKVPYDLRPRKQIERRMMGHTFQLLAEAGFPISTYRYAGFGAFFFVDFILFRRVLGIRDMVSMEHDTSSEKRVGFNRPFKDIEIKFQSSSEYLAQISPDVPHILWLDYDGPISQQHIQDIQTAASTLTSSSILITTFDVDFDKADEVKNALPSERKEVWSKRFARECADFYNPLWTPTDFAARHIFRRTIEVVDAAIRDGIVMRQGISFESLFSFSYADGHEMLTFGGMVTIEADRRSLRKVDWKQLPFIRRESNLLPFTIDYPVLTRKEKLYIDSEMPCSAGWTPAAFELTREEVDQYRSIHRYSPSYAELFL